MVDFHDRNADIITILNDPKYIEFSKELMLLSKNIVCEDVYETEIEFVIECLNAAEIDIDIINNIFNYDELRFWFFCTSFIEVERRLEVEQEFNPAEPMNDEEEPEETYIGHSRTTVIQYAIYYYLLINYKTKLRLFFTRIRQPHASKYAVRIIKFFDELNIK